MPEIIPNLHPAVVHFPITLITISLLFHIVAIIFKKKIWSAQLATVGHWTLWLGAALSVVAVIFGWQAYNSVNHDEAGHVAMLVHRSWALPTMTLLVILGVFDAWKTKATQVTSIAFILPLTLAWGLVMTTGWYGAELVYRHGLGVIALPESELEDIPSIEGTVHHHDELNEAAHEHVAKSHQHTN